MSEPYVAGTSTIETPPAEIWKRSVEATRNTANTVAALTADQVGAQPAIPAPPDTEEYYLLTQVNPGDTGVTWRTLDDIAGSLQPYDPDLTAIASLTGSTGLLKKTATNTWGLDTTSYMPSFNRSDIFNNDGHVHIFNTNFNTVPASCGAHYVHSSGTDSPQIPGAGQYYGFTMGLGVEFPTYRTQLAWPRAPYGGLPYLSVRYEEGGTWGTWSRIYAGYADSAGHSATTSQTTFDHLTVGTATGATAGQVRAEALFLTGIRTAPASPESGEVYKDADGFLKMG